MFTALQGNVSTHSSVARILLMLATAAVLSVGSVSAERPERHARLVSLAGLWEFTITLPQNPIVPEKILGLGTFTDDGTFLNTTTTPDQPIVPIDGLEPYTQDKVGFGHWLREGPREFRLETWRHRFSIETGNFLGYIRSQTLVEVTPQGNEMHGNIEVRVLDTDKVPILPPLVGTFDGFRIKLEPFPSLE